jgi:hypothetical protein
MGEVLAAAARDSDDVYLWAAIQFLADRLPDNDPDTVALTRVLRTRTAISTAAGSAMSRRTETALRQQDTDDQLRLM